MALFQKGQSGNPSGRPKKLDGLATMILEKTSDGKLLVECLLKIVATSEDNKDIISATKLLLEYGLGKPKESVEHSVDENLENILAASFNPPKPE